MQGGTVLLLLSFAGVAVLARDIPTECPAVDPVDTIIHLQHEHNCNQYYKCYLGQKILLDCTGGTVFDPLLQLCVDSSRYRCSPGGGVVVVPATESTVLPTESTEPPIECPAVDPLDTTIHLAHESDCNKFYKCSNGVKHLFSCAPRNPPLVFNPYKQVCVWPWDFNCTLSGSGSTGFPTDTPKPDVTVLPIIVPPTECPAIDPVHTTIHLAHEYDCNKFYKCSNGVKYLFSCAPSVPALVFDPVLQVCVWPWDFECNLSGTTINPCNTTEAPPKTTVDLCDTTTPPPVTTVPPPCNITDGTSTTTQTPCETPGTTVSVPPNECPAVDPLNTTIHLPHEYDCNKFYKCSNGVKYLFSCAPSDPALVFDPVLEVCVWPWEFECNLSGTTISPCSTTEAPPKTTVDLCETTTSPPVTTVPPPCNITDGTSTTTQTPCETPGTTVSVPPNECPAIDPLNTTIHLPHEYDCNKFYKCSNGVKYLFSCAPSDPPLVFDSVLQVCVWPWQYECTLPGNGPPVTTPPPCETVTVPGTTVENKHPNCEVCDGNSNIWPHETDCDKFWICEDSDAVLTTCSLGLQFNPSTKTCDFACNVNCVKSGSLSATARQNGLNIVIPWDKVGSNVLDKLEHDLHEIGVNY